MNIEQITIIRGEDRTIPLRFVDSDGLCLDIGAPDEVKVSFKNEDETILEKTLTDTSVSIVSAPRGEITVDLTDSETLLLMPGVELDILAQFTEGTITNKERFSKLLTVDDGDL